MIDTKGSISFGEVDDTWGEYDLNLMQIRFYALTLVTRRCQPNIMTIMAGKVDLLKGAMLIMMQSLYIINIVSC